GALTIQENIPRESKIEEIYYFADKQRNINIFLPLSFATWQEMESEDSSDNVSWAIMTIWNMIKESGCRTNDSEFVIKVINNREWPVFQSHINIDDAPSLFNFNVKISDNLTLEFILCSIPHEVQEALDYED
ncbi:MAG: hypothetical protein V1918_03030, partial [Planctomycetota bacterium]